MRQFRTSGSVEGVLGNWHSYSDSTVEVLAKPVDRCAARSLEP